MSDRTNLESLQSEFSDFYKDVHGFRPRSATEIEWNDEAWLEDQIKSLCEYIENLKTTFAGREELREQGWTVEETSPELVKWAMWLKTERDLYYSEREVA
jgi:hypothetical protein